MLLTFEEAVFVVNNGNLLLLETGCAVDFTVVVVEFSIRATHGLVVRLAAFHASTLGSACSSVNHAVPTQTTVLIFTRFLMAHIACRNQTGTKDSQMDGAEIDL